MLGGVPWDNTDKPGTMISRQAMGGKRRVFNVDKPKAARIDGLGTKYPFAHASGIYTEIRDAMLSGQHLPVAGRRT